MMLTLDNYLDFYKSMKSIALHLDNAEKLFLAEFGLTSPRFYILKHLHENPGISSSDLSTLMLCTKGNISRIIQDMMQDKLINRLQDQVDRRSFKLYLSKPGEQLQKEVESAYNDYIKNLLSKLNEDQIEIYSTISSVIEKDLSAAICA